MWWLVLVFIPMSAAQFSYKVDYDECNFCISPECVMISLAACKYYAKAAEILEEKVIPDEGDDEGFRLSVDGLLYDLVENAANFETCIPYISKYTDCTKENICTGCKTCRCDDAGTWRCSIIQQCQAVSKGVDRKKLRTVIESLKSQPVDQDLVRSKRFTISENSAEIETSSNCTEGEISTKTKQLTIRSSKTTLPNSNTSVSDHLENARAVEDKNNLSVEGVFNDEDSQINLQKIILKEDLSLLLMEKENGTEYSTISAKEFVHMLNALKESESTEPTAATEVVIDLLKLSSNYDDIDEDKRKLNREENDPKYFTTASDNENGYVIKRDVSTIENLICNDTVTYNSTTFDIKDLEENVLEPLTSIINTKKQEVDDLMKIQSKLLSLLNDHLNISTGIYNDTLNLDTSFLVYMLDMSPHRDMLRERDPKILDKYLFKLKHDIYQVMRDIAGIQKVSKSKLTKNLKILARAIQRYVHQEGGKHKTNKNLEIQRRRGASVAQSAKDYIVIILETIYNEAAEGNKMISLSLTAKTIIRRLVKEYYEDIDVIGLRLIESNINLTKYLAEVGSEWRNIFYDLMNSPPKNFLNHLKFLHIQFQEDITKIQNVLELIRFSQNRRLIIVEDVKTEIRAVRKLQNLLKFIDKNVAHMAINKTEKLNPNVVRVTESTSPKYSFLGHLKKLLKNSKTDILKLLHKNVPKTKIIKEAAKNHIDEVNDRKLHEYENTFQIPNTYFNSNIRSRRHLFGYDKHQHVMNQLKNILPKYLKEKFSGASAVKSAKVV